MMIGEYCLKGKDQEDNMTRLHGLTESGYDWLKCVALRLSGYDWLKCDTLRLSGLALVH